MGRRGGLPYVSYIPFCPLKRGKGDQKEGLYTNDKSLVVDFHLPDNTPAFRFAAR